MYFINCCFDWLSSTLADFISTKTESTGYLAMSRTVHISKNLQNWAGDLALISTGCLPQSECTNEWISTMEQKHIKQVAQPWSTKVRASTIKSKIIFLMFEDQKELSPLFLMYICGKLKHAWHVKELFPFELKYDMNFSPIFSLKLTLKVKICLS